MSFVYNLWCFDWGKRFTYNAWNITPFDLMYFLWFSYCDASWSIEYEAIYLMQHTLNQWSSTGFTLATNPKLTILSSDRCICSKNCLIGCTCYRWFGCVFCYLICAWLCIISCTSLFTFSAVVHDSFFLDCNPVFENQCLKLKNPVFCFYVMCLV